MKSAATAHAAKREDLNLDTLPANDRIRLIPIHLCFPARNIDLRHIRVAGKKTQRAFSLTHILTNRRFRDRLFGILFPQPHPDPVCRVALLPRRNLVSLQNPIDKRMNR